MTRHSTRPGSAAWTHPDHAWEALPADALDAFEERAAVAEYDGGLRREHAEVLAALCVAPPPAGATPEQVSSVIDAAARFLQRQADHRALA